jgi:hypothetical protein
MTHRSVIRIDTGGGLGAGFLFIDPRLAATAYHVVSQGRPIEVTLQDGTVMSAEVVATDPGNDVAIIELERPVAGLQPLLPGFLAQLKLGAPVIVIGHPHALDVSGREEGLLNWSVSQGIISGVGSHQLQTDAAVNPGNSGGPLIDCHGRVLGVVSAKLYAEGIGFVIPIDRVQTLAGNIGRVPPDFDTFQFSLGLSLAIHASSDATFAGFGVGLSAIVYDTWVATFRAGALWSTGDEEMEPGLLDRSLSRTMLALDLAYRRLVFTKPFPLYAGISLGGAVGRNAEHRRTLNAQLVPAGCAGADCDVPITVTETDRQEWMGWPSVGATLNVGGVLAASYAFLPDVTNLDASLHRVLIGFAF